MSVRREVVSLSQLLRRNENSSSSRRGTGRAPPLPLQSSRRRAETPLSAGQRTVAARQAQSAPFTEKPATSGYHPPSFTQRVLTSQSDVGVSSQASSGFPALSQEVYDPGSEQFSAMTSMSQSSFSQPQSQNLLGSSQDDQLHPLQRWQAEQALPAPKSPVRCNGSEKLQELEQNLTKAFVEQTCEQKHQQQELLMQFASPIKKSLAEVKGQLATSCESQQQQRVAIGGLEKGICNIAESVTELRQQSLSNKAVCEETRTAVTNETAAVKAALTELQAKVKTVESSVKSCSGLVAHALGAEATKHNELLSAVAASSCTCPKQTVIAEDSSDADIASKKRRRSPHRHEVAERNSGCFTSPAAMPAPRTKARSSPHCGVGSRLRYGGEDDEIGDEGLCLALQRIETLRAKRRHYQYGP
ncbi:hypothetical protein PC121_g13062 [Phytophthora cactorum]|nr:hypothetical protein PC120_g5868 [Phytophthora cactorum]KAG3061304.1 hypothetical protein PC121_g13062 [Phytophthora cactorum]KAG4053633.1 hypothetical protein PC123_g11227 [Phytophthora cactorum]